MQSVKGMWKKVTTFLDGGAEEEWDDEPGYGEYDGYSAGYDDSYDSDEYEDEGLDLAGITRLDRAGRKKNNNVLEFSNTREAQNLVAVRIARPKEIQDATLICEYLQEGTICIVIMQDVEPPLAQRIADYLGGVSYALKGQVERVDSYIFVIAPEGAKIDSDLKAEIKGGKLFGSFR